MDTKLFLSVLFFLGTIFPFKGFGQQDFAGRVNEYDEKGQKDGYWIEDGFRIVECYYKDGVKDGICKIFSPNRNLTFFSVFEEGKLVGPHYSFGDKGHLISIQKNFVLNTYSVTVGEQKQVPPNRCHTTFFHPNGRIASEGIMLFDGDPMGDFTFEYGEWKYYDDSGNLTETKNFQ